MPGPSSRFGSRSVSNGRDSPGSQSGYSYSASPNSRPGMGPITSPSARNGSLSRSAASNASRPPVDDIEQSRGIARTHYIELREYLTENGQAPISRSNAREKLTRLTRQQFQELSTDVYDELIRRKNAQNPNNEPFLPVQDSFHPKRNQARQKLATLPMTRFRDLGSDVFFELERRYPEFKEEQETLRQTPPPGAGLSTAANEVIVPNKSTLVEEDVGMPHRQAFSPGGPDETGRYDREYSDKRSMGRASEASSIGGKLIGGYGGHSDRDRHSWDRDGQDKMRSDYEYKVATLQQRVNSLEADLQDARSESQTRSRELARMRDLENESQNAQQRLEEQSATVRTLQRELSEARSTTSRNRVDPEEINRLRGELDDARHASQEHEDVIGELRQEVKGLLDELRSLNARHEDLVAEREHDTETNRQLEGQVAKFKQRYETAKTELRNLKATSQLFVQPPEQSDFMPASEDGAIADIHVTAFQSSIDSLLVAGRSSQPSSVLSLMKTVVIAITRLDADITDYERRRPGELPEADRERLQALKAKCNATLSNLVTAAKNHASGYGMSPVSLLDAAASHLSVTVIDMVKLVRVRKATSLELEDEGRSASSPVQSMSAPALNRANGASNGPAPLRIDALRSNSGPSGPPSAGLRASPHSPASMNGFGLGVTSGAAAPTPTSVAASRQRSETSDSYGNDRYPAASSSRPAAAAPSPPPSAGLYGRPTGEDARGRAGGLSPEYDRNDREPASPLSDGRTDEYDQGPTDAEDFDELRAYLEQQTEAIVHSIQALLAAIRGGAQGEELNDNLTNIITIVSSIVAISKENLPGHAKHEGDAILADLADNCDKLSEMQSASHATFSKQTKQSLASASFGVAKALKALNSFLAREAGDLT